MNKTLDTRKIIPGRNGFLFDDAGNQLAQVPKFQTQIEYQNSDYQAAGSAIVAAVPMSYRVTLNLTETVVTDVDLFKKMIDGLKEGKMDAFFDFQGAVKSPGGETQRLIYRECVPDGSIDLQNVQVGEIIERAWTFRVNQPPDLQEWLTGGSSGQSNRGYV